MRRIEILRYAQVHCAKEKNRQEIAKVIATVLYRRKVMFQLQKGNQERFDKLLKSIEDSYVKDIICLKSKKFDLGHGAQLLPVWLDYRNRDPKSFQSYLAYIVTLGGVNEKDSGRKIMYDMMMSCIPYEYREDVEKRLEPLE